VKVLCCGDAWFGITYQEDHPRAVENIRRLIEAGCYPKRLWPQNDPPMHHASSLGKNLHSAP
jgi:hypothetical protein